MTCPCDRLPAARPDIPPGLSRLPRAPGDFDAFRASMLARVRSHAALAGWRARDRDDLGVMLLEFWAYVADVVAVYDEVAANETYLRTAERNASIGRLAGLIGYRPRPATAGAAFLAVRAEGEAPVTLPAGTAFRSGAFDDEPPQVFELEHAAEVHPAANRWTIRAPRRATVGAGSGNRSFAALDLEPRGAAVEDGALVLIRRGGATLRAVRTVTAVEDASAADGTPVLRAHLSSAVQIQRSLPVAQVDIERPTQAMALWTTVPEGGTAEAPFGFTTAASDGRLVLERPMPGIRPGDRIILSRGDQHRWFSVTAVRSISRRLTVDRLIEYTVGEGDDAAPLSVPIPGATTRTTELTLDTGINESARRGSQPSWNPTDDAEAITVRFAMARAGRLAAEPIMEIGPDTEIALAGEGRRPLALPPGADRPRRFLFEDETGLAYAVKGSIEPATGAFRFEEAADWPVALTPPVTLYGNVVRVRRGETVPDERLGEGDPSVAGQSFALAKTPVTFLPDTSGASASGFRSTVRVRVDGIEWRESESFLGLGPGDEAFALLQTVDGETQVQFGDGVHGRRPPRGAVTASYRFGAGEAAPPARAIDQIAKPVKGVASVVNPLPAEAGSDAEGPDDVRDHGPGVALLLGRIVSIEDVRAAAAAWPGVRAVRADWRWHASRQAPVVQVWCIADGDLSELVRRIKALSDPSLAVDVANATPVSLRLALTVEIDPRHREDDVLPRLRAALLDRRTGLLAPERIGIGLPLFRSRLFAASLAVDGVLGVPELLADGAPFADMGLDPEAGRYFDVAAGGLVLNGRESDDGE